LHDRQTDTLRPALVCAPQKSPACRAFLWSAPNKNDLSDDEP
jgi:hypothetical protein